MLKKEKGSVTLIVLATILFIFIVLGTNLVYISSKRKSQLQETILLQNLYDTGMGATYNDQIEKIDASNNKITISQEEYEQLQSYKIEKENLEKELASLKDEKDSLNALINQLEKGQKNWTLVVSFNVYLGWNGNSLYGSQSGQLTITSVDGEISITQTGGTKSSPTESWNGSYSINCRAADFKIVSFTINED